MNETIREVLYRTSSFLYEEDSCSDDEATFLARRILCAVKRWTFTELIVHLGDTLSKEEQLQVDQAAIRVKNGEPIQYVVGYEEFCGRFFFVTEAALIPRPETEELVNHVCDFLQHEKSDWVLEIGVGTGCMIHTLALEMPHHHYEGCDISTEALKVAQRNKEHHHISNVALFYSDVWEQVPKRQYRCIVSNPPYISEEERSVMDASVINYEPHIALFANKNGLEVYEKIAQRLEEFLAVDGEAFFEIGYRQKEAVCTLFRQYIHPSRPIECKQDMMNHDRIIWIGKRKEGEEA